jgi:2-amino-4-hydroxy-6-hydroxymethyldihydropteridine diphosphokinase
VIDVSGLYETAPVGGPEDQDVFLNAAIALKTTLNPLALLDLLLAIEQRFHRQRLQHWGPRTLDLDLLLYGDEIVKTPRLTVPHPLLHQRAFVLVPMKDIAATAIHPVLNQTIQALYKSLPNAHNDIIRIAPAGRGWLEEERA